MAAGHRSIFDDGDGRVVLALNHVSERARLHQFDRAWGLRLRGADKIADQAEISAERECEHSRQSGRCGEKLAAGDEHGKLLRLNRQIRGLAILSQGMWQWRDSFATGRRAVTFP